MKKVKVHMINYCQKLPNYASMLCRIGEKQYDDYLTRIDRKVDGYKVAMMCCVYALAGTALVLIGVLIWG